MSISSPGGAFDPLVQAGILKDDCIVSEISMRKQWVDQGNEGAEIIITW